MMQLQPLSCYILPYFASLLIHNPDTTSENTACTCIPYILENKVQDKSEYNIPHLETQYSYKAFPNAQTTTTTNIYLW
jgi:hypothetical protein